MNRVDNLKNSNSSIKKKISEWTIKKSRLLVNILNDQNELVNWVKYMCSFNIPQRL